MSSSLSSSCSASFFSVSSFSRVKRNDVFGGKNEGKFSRQDTSLKHQRRRRLRTMKAQSNAETPTETETEQKTNQSNKFIPAHMRKTVSRITEAQMKTNGVELSKAATQVQESIAGFLAFEFLRARVKNCAKCHQSKDVLFRCRHADFDWLFLCETCLLLVKNEHEATYTFGGTWKSKKK